MKKRIFVTREIPQIGIDILQQYYDVDIFPEKRPITKNEMISGAMDCDGLLPLLTDKVDAEVMDDTGIKAIANYAVGRVFGERTRDLARGRLAYEVQRYG